LNEINKSDEIIKEVSDKEKTDETIEKPSSEMPEKQGEFTNKQIEEESKELASQKTEKRGKKSADTKQEKDTEKALKKKGDFHYIVRIADTDIDGNKNIIYGLTKIKGIGFRMSVFVVDAAGIERNKKIGELSEPQVEKIKVIINNLISNVPNWMLNHRKDHDTGKDNHYISTSIDMRLRDNININIF